MLKRQNILGSKAELCGTIFTQPFKHLEDMRMLNTRTLQVEEFLESASTSTLVHFEGSNVSDVAILAYAILSHTWGDGEVSFQDMQGHRELAKRKEGFAKLRDSCALALKEGYDYIWIDTCCIDKTSSAELSEAINSNFDVSVV